MLDKHILPEVMPLLSAALITGAIVLLGLSFLAVLGVCWACAFALSLVLAHTTSTQALLMGGVCYVLYRIAKRMHRKGALHYARQSF